MKKLFTASALALAAVFSVSAQKLPASKVPDAVKQAFEKNFPGMTASWEKEKSSYEAGFKAHGKTMSALFEASGTLTETEMDIKTTELPRLVLAYIRDNYKDAPIKEAAKITKAGGTVLYEAEVNKKDVLFHQDGTFYKESAE